MEAIGSIDMKKYFAVNLNSDGEITLPAQILEEAGFLPSDTIIVRVDAIGTITLRRLRFTLDELTRIVPALKVPDP